jgi:hypothetical protein
MLIVDVVGSNKTKRDIAYNVVYFMLQKLLPRLRNIEIEVKFSKMDDDAVGYCMMLDNNREYQLEISKDLNIKELVMTICHEMVHVKQYVRNEMKEGQMVWKKKPIASDTKYYDLPWEKEAYAMQASLAKACWNKGIF